MTHSGQLIKLIKLIFYNHNNNNNNSHDFIAIEWTSASCLAATNRNKYIDLPAANEKKYKKVKLIKMRETTVKYTNIIGNVKPRDC